MIRYANKGGNSNVYAYKIDLTQITVSFYGGLTYVYTYTSTGLKNTETMKQLAIQGRGLNGFINRYVGKNFAYKY